MQIFGRHFATLGLLLFSVPNTAFATDGVTCSVNAGNVTNTSQSFASCFSSAYGGPASSSVNAETGILRAAYSIPGVSTDQQVYDQLDETLTFSGLGSGTYIIPVTMDVHGSYGVLAADGAVESLANLALSQGYGVSDQEFYSRSIPSSQINEAYVQGYNGTSSVVSFDPSNTILSVTDFVSVNAQNPSFHILAQLELDGYDSFSDFSHTASLSIAVPNGLSYTSATGTFLTGAVPEPSTWAMMLAGFGLIGCAMRKKAHFKWVLRRI